jgi:hypothetical protein
VQGQAGELRVALDPSVLGSPPLPPRLCLSPASVPMAPGALHSYCLILLNTQSQPRVNWFYSSLLCLPLNEEMPPIKF